MHWLCTCALFLDQCIEPYALSAWKKHLYVLYKAL